MKHTYLVTTATAALLAGTMFAAAQGMQKQTPGGATDGGGQGQMQREQNPQREQGQTQREQSQEQAPGQKGKQGQREQGKQGTTGQGPVEKGKQQGQAKEQGKNGDAQKEQGKGATTGQRQGNEGQREGQREGQQGQREGQQGQARQGSSGNVTLTVEQRTKVRETVLVRGPRVGNVNFNINVGVEVPSSVRIVEVDPLLIEYYPNYRGHFYFIVNDQIIIVDRNHRIVAVINV